MELNYKSPNGRLVFKVSAETPKEIFKEIALIQDLFEAETSCGHCAGEDLKFQVRTTKDGHLYYELVCRGCYARFSFGQSKDTKHLFPKRKDEDGAYLDNRGWQKYERG